MEPDLESEEVLELDKFVEGENQKLPRLGLHLDDIECLQGEEHILKTLQNDSLYVGRKLVTDIRDFWIHDLKPSSFVVDVIETGYKLRKSPLKVLKEITCQQGKTKILSEVK